MLISVEEFNNEFFQEVLSESDVEGQFAEDIFFEKYCQFLTEAGEISTADRAYYRNPNLGIRIDGYGGDPALSQGTLSLIVVDFAQSSDVGRLVGSEMNAIFQRGTKFLTKSLDQNWRNSLEETGSGFGLADMISQRWGQISRVRMFLISNRELSERVDGRDADEIDGRSVAYSVWDIKRLHRFATQGHGREEIEIDLVEEFGAAVPLLPAHLSADEYEAYLAVVPGQMLAAIYDRWGARLLEQNVRVFLQARGNVNKGIRNTLLNDPSMFFAYNNGITATAEAIQTSMNGGQLELVGLKNLQIVNGGQTTASIHAAYRGKVNLSQVSVQMKLSIVEPERTEEVVPKISEFANSQNRVNAADFFANHPFHVRMEEFSRRLFSPSPDGTFRETKWFYERARGQFADARSLLTPAQRKKFDLENPRSQLFSKTDLAKYLNVWRGIPEKVCAGAQKNFVYFAHDIGKAWTKSEDSFNEAYFREVVSKAIVFRSAEKLVSKQDWYPGTIRSQIVAYSIAKLAHDVANMDRSVNFPELWRTQALSPTLEKAFLTVAKRVNDEWLNPDNRVGSVGEWAKKQACWARIRGLKIEWPEDFKKELVTFEAIKAETSAGKKDQKVLNGIQAQTLVVDKGNDFWSRVIDWGQDKNLLSREDQGILRSATRMPSRVPSELQAKRSIEILKRLNDDGCPENL